MYGGLLGGPEHRRNISLAAKRQPLCSDPSKLWNAYRKATKFERSRLKNACQRVIKRSGRRAETPGERFLRRYKNDPAFRVYQLCRRRMRKMIFEGVKRGTTLELMGCTQQYLRAHLESQFKQGMNWGNSGTGKGKWHIDHITPCSAFDMTNRDEQRRCFHWTNLRPMWSKANIRKSSKLNHANNQGMLLL